MDEHVTPEPILQLGLAFWGSKTLLSAVELGLFTLLADGPLSADVLTARLKLHPRSVRDFLDAELCARLQSEVRSASGRPAEILLSDAKRVVDESVRRTTA